MQVRKLHGSPFGNKATNEASARLREIGMDTRVTFLEEEYGARLCDLTKTDAAALSLSRVE
jgi:hypothetical protein